MGWGNKSGSKFSGKGKKRTGVRLTGLFKTKKQGLLTGKLREEEVKGLAKIVKRALVEEKEIVFFAYKNDEGPAIYSIIADVQEDSFGSKGGGGKKSFGGGKSRRDEEEVEDDNDGDDLDSDDSDAEEKDDKGDEDIDL